MSYEDVLHCLQSHVTFTGICLRPEDKALGARAGVAAGCVAAQSVVTQQTIDGAFINVCGQRDGVSELRHQHPLFYSASSTELWQPERHRNAVPTSKQYSVESMLNHVCVVSRIAPCALPCGQGSPEWGQCSRASAAVSPQAPVQLEVCIWLPVSYAECMPASPHQP